MLGSNIQAGAIRRCVCPYSYQRNIVSDASIRIPVFIRTEFNDPLLCLTASVTLRDKPLTSSPQRRELFKLIESSGPLPPLLRSDASEQESRNAAENDENEDYVGHGFLEEVNLLEGLTSGK